MLSAGFTYQKPLSKRGSLILSARRSFTDQYQTKLYNKIHNFLISGSGLNIGLNPNRPYSYIRALYNLIACVGVGVFGCRYGCCFITCSKWC